MQVLGLAGSLRAASTNLALLAAASRHAPEGLALTISDALHHLPPFNPDLEGPPAPSAVEGFATEIARADALVIACPEYVHALPGALKNAIDWMVSRPEIVGKSIALLHGSHRGADVLADLDRVLATVSDGYDPALTLHLPVVSMTPEEVATACDRPETSARLRGFLEAVQRHAARRQATA